MKPETTSRRVQTILKGFAKHGSYTLPNGSIVVRIEAMSTGKPGPCVRIMTDENGNTYRACDGSSLLFRLDQETGCYTFQGKTA